MATVAITQQNDIEQAIGEALEHFQLEPRIADIAQVDFPTLSMKDAIKAFTKKVYGRELTFEHA